MLIHSFNSQDGAKINIDGTGYLNGYHGETSATFFCGDDDDEARKLVQDLTVDDLLTNVDLSSINYVIWNDNWTAVAEDGGLSAQFEHTIMIIPDGVETITQC
ncbi:hypothetical protein Lal_00007842 [Lupinus albus]|nr:hypothetical protein Lal_00007842 [Lupinus albus]